MAKGYPEDWDAKHTDPELRLRLKDEVAAADEGGKPGQVRAVRDYEQQHGNRKTVLDRAGHQLTRPVVVALRPAQGVAVPGRGGRTSTSSFRRPHIGCWEPDLVGMITQVRTPEFEPVPRTTPTRSRERVGYDRTAVHAVLDEATVCHVGFVVDGEPVVLPQLHVRVGDQLYLHGSTGARALRMAAGPGLPVCVTATLVDGLVLARSAFHHSINYRSVVAHGTALVVIDAVEKSKVLTALVEAVVPGRSSEVREPSARELAATTVLRLPLREVSLKARTGPPGDDPDDAALPYWSGVLPVTTTTGRPVPAHDVPSAVPLPAHLLRYGVPSG